MKRRPPRSTRTEALFPYTTLFRSTSSGIHDFDWSRAQSRAGVRTLDFLQPWASKNADTLVLEQQGQGRPWVTLRSLAAVPLDQAVSAGYAVQRSIDPVRSEGRRFGKACVSTCRSRWAADN